MIRLRRRWEREDITMKVAEKLIEGVTVRIILRKLWRKSLMTTFIKRRTHSGRIRKMVGLRWKERGY